MTQTLSGSDALAALIGDAAADSDAAQAATQPQGLTCRVPHDLLLEQLYHAIDDLVPNAVDELRPIRRRLWAWMNPADDVPAPSPRAVARRVRGVELAWTVTVHVAPAVGYVAELNQPHRYLPPFYAVLRSYLWGARRSYCSAVAAALDDGPLEEIERLQEQGGAYIKEFTRQLQYLYLDDPRGLQGQIQDLGKTVVSLVALRAERGAEALPTRAADAATRVAATPVGGPWFRQAALLLELGERRADFAAREDPEPYLRFSQTIEGYGVAIQLLATRERLDWLADQQWFNSDALTRIRGYVTGLGDALISAENAISLREQGRHVEAAAAQHSAVTKATAVTSTAQFTTDLDEIADTLQLQAEIKAVAAGVAIAAVTVATAGAAGAVAGTALSLVVDTSTAFGALVVSGGTIAARLAWETLVARAGSELLLGPDSIKDSTFTEDLGWQALQSAVVFVVLRGGGNWFAAIEKAAVRGRLMSTLAKIAVEQITTYGFGEMQHVIKTGHTRTLRQGLVAAASQISGVAVGAVAGALAKSFDERIGAARTDLGDEGKAALVKVEQDRATLMTEFEPVKNGTATDAEFLAWAQRAAEVWNRYAGIVQGLPAGVAKQAALGQLTLAKGAIELRLAELGISATLTVPDGVPMFEGILPGLVAVSEDGRPVLDDAVPANRRRPTDVPDGVLAQDPDGRRQLFLPEDALPDSPMKPARLAHVPEANVLPTESPEVPPTMDPVAAIGLERLMAAAPTNWRKILAGIADGQVESFLSLLAHDQLANPASLKSRLRKLAALGKDAESLEFARLWGPDLALRLRLRCGTRGKEFRNDLRRADGLLEATPEADRQALIDRMLAAGNKEALRRILGTGKPPRPKSGPQTSENLGVDRSSREWRLLRDELKTAFPAVQTKWVALADFRQAYRKARTPAMRKATAEQRRQMVLDFDALLVTAGIRPEEGQAGDHRPANNLRGKYAEYLFVPDGMDQQTRWYKRNPNAGNATGRSDLDGHRLEAGTHIFLELKSDEIHEQTPGRLAATARKYLAQAQLDVNDNLPAGSKYYLWFIHPPKGGQAAQDAMQAILVLPNGAITEVFFGPDLPPPLQFP